MTDVSINRVAITPESAAEFERLGARWLRGERGRLPPEELLSRQLVRAEKSALGKGGMESKLEAARIVTGAGEPLVVAGGAFVSGAGSALPGITGAGFVFCGKGGCVGRVAEGASGTCCATAMPAQKAKTRAKRRDRQRINRDTNPP